MSEIWTILANFSKRKFHAAVIIIASPLLRNDLLFFLRAWISISKKSDCDQYDFKIYRPFFVILLPILYFYVSHDPNFFTNVSTEWSRLFLISSTCVQNDFWRFRDAIKQKIKHLRSKNPSKLSFRFLNWIFLLFCFPFYISTCHTIQIFSPTYPSSEVDYLWYLQRAFKMIFDASATQLNKKIEHLRSKNL